MDDFDSIKAYPYRLRVNSGLKGRVATDGVLLKIDEGFSVLHPQSSLGDLLLEQQIEALRAGEITPLLRQSLVCARIDAQARKKGISLFENLEVPETHCQVLADLGLVKQVEQLGFKVLKLKMDKDWKKWVSFLSDCIDQYPKLRWRLDFNGQGSFNSLEKLLSQVKGLKQQVDFIEDPVALEEMDVAKLKDLGVPIALDRHLLHLSDEFKTSDFIGIYKPAIDDPKILESNIEEWVVTSYLEHPLGALWAAYCAALFKREQNLKIQHGGWIEKGIFDNDWTHGWNQCGPSFRIPSGTGLGMDKYLGRLEWMPLI